MGKKNLFQIVLTFLLLLAGFLTFSTYYKSDNNKSKKIEIKDTKSAKSKDNKNLIQDIKYTSNNTNGDIFEILAEYGEPSSEIPELMFLTNVTGNIFLKNKSNIQLTSDYPGTTFNSAQGIMIDTKSSAFKSLQMQNRKSFGLGLNLGMGVNGSGDVGPYIGIGVSWNPKLLQW